MNNTDKIINAINFIEENISSDINLEIISREVGISKFHFQRVFQSIVGDPLSTYLRNRRLSLSLEKLLTTNKKIIDIAFYYQFNSHEAYIRSFRSYFNTTPYLARRDKLKVKAYKRFNPTNLKSNTLQSYNLKQIVIENQFPLTISGMSYSYTADDFSISKQVIQAGKLLSKEIDNIDEYYMLVTPKTKNNGQFIIGTKGHHFKFDNVEIIESNYLSFKYNGVPRRVFESIDFLYNYWLPNNIDLPLDKILLKYPNKFNCSAMYSCKIIVIFKT